jgi:hypothetical protein
VTRRTRARLALFPGDRRVWLVAAALGTFFLVATLIAALTPREYYTGTSSVRLRSFPIELAKGQQLCVPQRIPAGTGRVELWVDTDAKPRPALDFEVQRGDSILPGRTITPSAVGPHKVQFAIEETAGEPDAVEGEICLRTAGKLFVGGMGQSSEFDPTPTIDGKAAPARIAVWYRPPAGEKRSVAAALPDIFDRASRFRPGIVGPWTYALILFLVLPGLIYAGLRVLAGAETERRRRLPLAAAVALLAFGHAACWALVSPAFQAPDEPEHFAYAYRVAETGKGLNNNPQLYSSDQVRAWNAMRTAAMAEAGDGRPPWLAAYEDDWKRAESRGRLARDDGGGAAAATGSHSPVYYGTLAATYRVTRSASIWTTLTAMRITSALYGALAAACAALILLELMPRRRLLAAAGGLLVAFHPMFAFMSGAVNNDMGVNGMSALLLYLVLRAWTRGPTPAIGAAIGAVLIVAPLMKGTAYAIYPAALFGLGAAALRYRTRRTLLALAAVGVSAAVLFVAWSAVSGHFDRSTFTTPGGTAPGSDFEGVRNPFGLLSYLWQVFFPPLSFMTDHWLQGKWPYYDIYVVRGWADFGWYAMTFSDWVYWVIAFAMPVVAALSVTALIRHRHTARRLLVPGAVLLLAIGGVFAGVHAFYFPVVPRADSIPEQGRYIFPTIVALATIAVAATYAFGRRWVVPLATTLVVCVMGTAYAAQLMALTRFYT